MAITPDLSGRVAVITGASSGMGEHTARHLAECGAAVALLARRGSRLQAIVEEIKAAGGTALAVPVDVTDHAAVEHAAAFVKRELGSAGIVFNNAGIMLPNPILERRLGEWTTQIDVNIRGALSVISSFLDQLVETAAAGAPADLINTASIAAHNLYSEYAVYSASKSFVKQLSYHLRMELGGRGVRVCDLSPGAVRTELHQHLTNEHFLAEHLATAETRQWLTGANIGEVVGFVVGLPANVNLQEVIVMPTEQVS